MKILILMICLSGCLLHAQEYGLGLLLDDKKLDSAPRSPNLMRGDYSNLPDSTSLRQYAPVPGNQGTNGTCTGWSAAYGARTIIEAREQGWKGQTITDNAFSPSFIYNQIRYSKNCNDGASIIDALNVLKEQGDVLYKDFGYECGREVTEKDIAAASKYRIIEYRQVAGRGDSVKTKFVKKSLAECKPVVIAFDCPASLNKAKSVWIPAKDEYHEWSRGHAMTVIGYNDKKYGGAFEILNSWGPEWGDKGFTYIKYDDFNYFCKLAFEIIGKPPADTLLRDLSGDLNFSESGGRKMRATFNGKYFSMINTYHAGTLFELRIANDQPAYVYALSSDLKNNIERIFPKDELTITYLPYKKNNIAIPDEDSYCMLDTVQGVSYFCFLYSKESMNLDSLSNRIKLSKGNFWDRLVSALGEMAVHPSDIKYSSEGSISFEATSKGRKVVPVLVEIKQR